MNKKLNTIEVKVPLLFLPPTEPTRPTPSCSARYQWKPTIPTDGSTGSTAQWTGWKNPKTCEAKTLFFEGELWKIHNRLYCRPHLHPAYSMAKGKVNRAAFVYFLASTEQLIMVRMMHFHQPIFLNLQWGKTHSPKPSQERHSNVNFPFPPLSKAIPSLFPIQRHGEICNEYFQWRGVYFPNSIFPKKPHL